MAIQFNFVQFCGICFNSFDAQDDRPAVATILVFDTTSLFDKTDQYNRVYLAVKVRISGFKGSKVKALFFDIKQGRRRQLGSCQNFTCVTTS